MISTLAVLKKKMAEKPWLYEEEEHAVLKLAEDAIAFIGSTTEQAAKQWLEEHK